MTTRLIERHLPIAAIGEESTRERRSMTALPAIYWLHVWWARRPLIASRAAVLASMLPESTSDKDFLNAIGITGDPVLAARKLDAARRSGNRIEEPYGYERAFKFTPSDADLDRLIGEDRGDRIILDVTAGGGAIPFEASRLGFSTIANDLNPVASTVLKATVEYPAEFGSTVLSRYKDLADRFEGAARGKLSGLFPQPAAETEIVTTYLWARTIRCLYCEGLVPLSPNWKIEPGKVGVRLHPQLGEGPGDPGRVCNFEIVHDIKLQAEGTVARGDVACPYPDCGRAIPVEDVRKSAIDGSMGDQLFAVVVKRLVKQVVRGRAKNAWVRDYRAPTPEDYATGHVETLLAHKLVEWEARGILPNEMIGELHPKWDVRIWGMKKWTDFFSDRQLLAHGLLGETFRDLLEQEHKLDDVTRAAYVYLAISLDKLLDWNSKQCTWEPGKLRMAHTFAQHAFAFKWSYAEMTLDLDSIGLSWALKSTTKALKELILLTRSDRDLLTSAKSKSVQVLNGSGARLTSVPDGSVDAVIMDPPYGANVMYATLSDFFYVWLKRTAGLVLPEIFIRATTDKNAEAVANKALFVGQQNSDRLATKDYENKMQDIFLECRRVLKPDGVLTVMFTHKDTGAWDALAKSLIEAGFVTTASWPVNTEASDSLHIKNKAAANSTIFLVCRPRLQQGDVTNYWEDVEPLVAKAVRDRIDEFQTAGIAGVDLYLASFGPALEAFSRHWPLTRGTPAPQPPAKRGSQGDLLEEFDPYAVRPEDALNAARREVKAWRLAQLADRRASRDMDPATAWVALAWDAFRAPQFAYDEGLRLARAVGLDMTQVVGRIAEKKGSDLKLWDSATRVAKGALGPANGSRGMIDALHHVAHTARKQSVEAARDLLEANGLLEDDGFKVALEVMLEVLPPSKTFSGIDADDAVKPAADDFDALEKLRRIVYGEEIGAPKQLLLYEQLDAA